MTINLHSRTVAGFGDEWTRFDQRGLSREERQAIFDDYFHILPSTTLNPEAIGADFGVGSGRWAALVAPKVRQLYCVDASIEALAVARRSLEGSPNCTFLHSTIDDAPISPGTLDFAYSLGVLHHIPHTRQAMAACVEKLKPGAPFLVYLYYRFDNRPGWFRGIWRASEAGRALVSRMPHGLRYAASQVIAGTIYWPLASLARVVEKLGIDPSNLPLSAYRSKSFYTMRTDALDRFGTQLEQRFTKSEIGQMMRECGLEDIRFSDREPFWCAVGTKVKG